MNRNRILVVIAVAIALVLGACSDNSKSGSTARENVQDQSDAINTGLQRQIDSQQIPTFDYSQERQTLIDALTIRATGSLGTTQFLLEGVGLVGWCPSAGAPVPSTYQLTPSQQYVDIPRDDTRAKFPTDLAEPTGVITGDSNGTWVICLDDAGNRFGVYHEGPVSAVVGVIQGLDPDLRFQPSEITYQFDTGE